MLCTNRARCLYWLCDFVGVSNVGLGSGVVVGVGVLLGGGWLGCARTFDCGWTSRRITCGAWEHVTIEDI